MTSDFDAVLHLLGTIVLALQEQVGAHVPEDDQVGHVVPPVFDFRRRALHVDRMDMRISVQEGACFADGRHFVGGQFQGEGFGQVWRVFLAPVAAFGSYG